MFKDLAVLVDEQGEMVERIDANMESVNIKTKKGLSQLHAAEKQQKKCTIS